MFEEAEIGHTVSKEEFSAREPQLRVDLINAQYDLATADFPLVILLSGDDRYGCSEVVDRVQEWIDARYVAIHFLGQPSDDERQRPTFWRFWRAMPPKGRTGILLGSYVINAIADVVLERTDESGLERRLRHMRRLEEALVNDGTLLLKFWLHVPKPVLDKRIKKAKKNREAWLLDLEEEDWVAYDDYGRAMNVAERIIRGTNVEGSPWTIVESSDARYRDLTLFTTVLEALRRRLDGDRVTRPASAATPPAAPSSGALSTVDLSRSLSRAEYKERLDRNQSQLARLTRKARKKRLASVLVFEGWDAAGKGGVIRRITRAMSARDYVLVPIGAPTDEEKAYHYLWRFWRRLPRAGQMVIFDRSWYGRVLVERVEGFAPVESWQRAYDEINDFEEQLVAAGWPVFKFWLHIDPDEQMRRFRAREQTPYKKYKLTDEDFRNRGKWDEYVAAADDMVARTSTPIAPWHLVPANDKRVARVEVLRTVCRGLKDALGSTKRGRKQGPRSGAGAGAG